MLRGLRDAFRNYVGTSVKGSVDSFSSPDLDKVLVEDSRTRKQQLSKFSYYQEKIKTRHAAETKLRQSAGMYLFSREVERMKVLLM